MQKFQGGGAPVFGLDPNAGGQSYKPDNNQLFSVATMPLESGLQAYMGMQQLQNQQKQFELQKKDLDLKIRTADKAALMEDYRIQSTIRDDFFKVEVLPEDAEAYKTLVTKNIPPDLIERAAKGDQEASKEMVRRSTALFMNPEMTAIRSRKLNSDRAYKDFLEIPKDLIPYVENYDEIINAHASGKQIPPTKINMEQAKIQRDIDNKLQQDAKAATTAKVQQELIKLQEENIINQQLRDARINNSMNDLKIEGRFEDQTPEIQKQIIAKSLEGELKQKEAEQNIKIAESRLKETAAKISVAQANKFDELIASGMGYQEAAMGAGLKPTDIKLLVESKIWSDRSLTDDQKIAKIKDFETKTSDVNYHTDKVSNQGYQQDTKSSDRLYPNHVRNSEGTEIKSVTINGVVIPNKKESFPDDGSVSIEIRYGKPYLKVKESTKAKDWLKSNYKWDWDSGYNDDIYDFIEEGKKPGTIYDNNELHIPIEDEAKPAQNSTANNVQLNTTVYSIKDDSVNIKNLDSGLVGALNELATSTNNKGKAIITSGNDSTKHVSNSQHYNNKAVDIHTKSDPHMAPYLTTGIGAQILKKHGYYAVLEDAGTENEHIHIEPISGGSNTSNTKSTTGKNW